jgi:hypothetical protein
VKVKDGTKEMSRARQGLAGYWPLTKFHYEDNRGKAGKQAANGVEDEITLTLYLLILERILAEGDCIRIRSV